MNRLIKRTYLLALWLVVGCILTSPATGQNFTPSSTGDDAQNTANILRLGINAADIQTLDPHYAAAFPDRLVVDMVYNALIRYKPGQAPEVEPDLAREIPEPVMIDERQTWTFRLKPGVMFHPGPGTPAYELTADDVVYSFAKAADPKRSAYAGEYTHLQVVKIDRYTCRFLLDYPLSPTLFFSKIVDYAGGLIISRRAAQTMGDEGLKWHPVGTGPFHFDSYASRRSLALKSHRDYFRGTPLLTGVTVFFLPQANIRDAQFLRGELDVIRGIVETGWMERFQRQPGTRVDIFGVSEVANIHFNIGRAPFNDRKVRLAVAHALDRDRFLAPFGENGAVKVYAPIPEAFLPGGLSSAEVLALGLDYAPNAAKSRQLLAAAGYTQGIELTLPVSEVEIIRKNYHNLKEQLEPIGIRLKLEEMDHAAWHREIRRVAPPLVIYEAIRPNLDVFLQRFFHSESIVATGLKPDTNFSHYRNLDHIIAQARRESDTARQIKLWKYAQVKLLEDMVVYPLHYHPRVYARKNYVDYGHPLTASMALYPQFTENTRLISPRLISPRP